MRGRELRRRRVCQLRATLTLQEEVGVATARGRDTAAVLAEVLGLTDAEIRKLAATGVIPGSDDDND